jgi:hypothetical protein
MRALALIFVLALSACVTPKTVGFRLVPGPGGEEICEAYCNGPDKSYGDCMTLAAHTCVDGKYELISKDGASATQGSGSMYWQQSVAVMTRQVMYRCTVGLKYREEPPVPEAPSNIPAKTGRAH